MLLDAGADLAAADDKEKRPIHLAASEGYADTVAFLAAVPGADPSIADSDGLTPLHCSTDNAVRRPGNDADGVPQSVAGVLLAAGADVEATAISDGGTPLMWAAQRRKAGIVAELIRAGAVVDAVDSYGQTALHRAATYGWEDCVLALLDAGASVAAVDGSGNTPLHVAAGGSWTATTVGVLIAAGAALDAINGDGLTPDAVAIASGNQQVIDAFAAAGGGE